MGSVTAWLKVSVMVSKETGLDGTLAFVSGLPIYIELLAEVGSLLLPVKLPQLVLVLTWPAFKP
jgi:hypothetical protein